MSTDGTGPDWFGLLKWSLGYSDGTNSSSFNPMSDEDKAFLERAFQNVNDEASSLKNLLIDIKNFVETQEREDSEEDVPTIDDMEEKLELITDISDQVDMAEIFVKLGGLEAFFKLFTSRGTPKTLRASVARSVGSIAQNHIHVQDAIFRTRLIDTFCEALIAELSHEDINAINDSYASRLLFGISASIRGHAAAEESVFQQHLIKIFDKVYQYVEAQCGNDLSALRKPQQDFVPSLMTLQRLLFLSHALFVSDNSSSDRKRAMSRLWFPRVCYLIEAHSSIDLREICVRIIKESLKSQLIRSIAKSYESLLISVIDRREELLTSQEGVDRDEDDQISVEKSQLQSLRIALTENIQQLFDGEEEGNRQANGDNNNTNASNSTSANMPLLLGP